MTELTQHEQNQQEVDALVEEVAAKGYVRFYKGLQLKGMYYPEVPTEQLERAGYKCVRTGEVILGENEYEYPSGRAYLIYDPKRYEAREFRLDQTTGDTHMQGVHRFEQEGWAPVGEPSPDGTIWAVRRNGK